MRIIDQYLFYLILKRLLRNSCTKDSNFLDIKNLIYSLQFGFQQKYSTTHALIKGKLQIKVALVVVYLQICKRHLILLIIKPYCTNQNFMESMVYVMTVLILTYQIISNLFPSMAIILIYCQYIVVYHKVLFQDHFFS